VPPSDSEPRSKPLLKGPMPNNTAENEFVSSTGELLTEDGRFVWPFGPKPYGRVIFLSDPEIDQVSGIAEELNRRGLFQSPEHRIVALSGDLTRAVVLPRDMLRVAVTDWVAFLRWVSEKKGGTVSDVLRRVAPPRHLIDATHQRADYPELRTLNGVRRAPFVASDGSVVTAAGYHEGTGLILSPDRPIDLPTNPTRAQALEMRDYIFNEVYRDFRLDPVSLAVSFSIFLSIVARKAIGGPVPIHLVDAPVAGSGKTLEMQVSAAIGAGEFPALTGFRSNQEEFSKTLLSQFREGPASVLIDNVKNAPLGVPELDAALTSPTGRMTIRILGELTPVSVPCDAVICASGNGIRLAGDLGRRSLWITIDPKCEKPEERSGWHHENLSGWVRENLAQLNRAALIIWMAWVHAGKPRSDLQLLGSFEGWSLNIRDLLLWLDMANPCESRKLTAQRDDEAEFLRAFLPPLEKLVAAKGGQGLTISEIVNPTWLKQHADLESALVDFRTPAGHVNTKMLGHRLKSFLNRIVDGRKLVSPERTRHGQRVWKVVNATN